MSSIPQQQNMILEYTPADFFYLTNASDMPKGGCGSTPIACTNISAGVACYQQELCRNKELVEQMYLKRDKHSSAEAKYTDMQNKYKFEVIKTINLGIGIIASITYIYYNI